MPWPCGAWRNARPVAYERSLQLLALLTAAPGTLTALLLLWFGEHSAKVQWTLSTFILGGVFLCASAVRQRIVFPLQTLSNLLAALREGDYSLRARQANRDDVLGEVLWEVNTLSQTLLDQRRVSQEASALLQAVMAQIDVAIFTFDEGDRLRLVNASGCRLLDGKAESLRGRSAQQLGLAVCLAQPEGGTHALSLDFPAAQGKRWGVRCTSFRQDGKPHRLLALADLSQPLREEERLAWQRLIRVLGHELNNSLAPIQSIAGSLATLLARPEPQRAPDWRDDLDGGLRSIASRAETLGALHGGVLALGAAASAAKAVPGSWQPRPASCHARNEAGCGGRVWAGGGNGHRRRSDRTVAHQSRSQWCRCCPRDWRRCADALECACRPRHRASKSSSRTKVWASPILPIFSCLSSPPRPKVPALGWR